MPADPRMRAVKNMGSVALMRRFSELQREHFEAAQWQARAEAQVQRIQVEMVELLDAAIVLQGVIRAQEDPTDG